MYIFISLLNFAIIIVLFRFIYYVFNTITSLLADLFLCMRLFICYNMFYNQIQMKQTEKTVLQ